jgi:hypothetical protein
VTSIVLLVEDYRGTDLFVGPQRILRISKFVHVADKHSNRHRTYGIDGDQVSGAFVANIEESVVVRSPDLESGLFQILSIVQKSFGAATIGFVVYINLESILIIILRVITDKKSLKRKADW